MSICFVVLIILHQNIYVSNVTGDTCDDELIMRPCLKPKKTFGPFGLMGVPLTVSVMVASYDPG